MNSLNKTFVPTKNYKNRNWYVIDCKGQSLGRLATVVTSLLKGKIKPQYHPSSRTLPSTTKPLPRSKFTVSVNGKPTMLV